MLLRGEHESVVQIGLELAEGVVGRKSGLRQEHDRAGELLDLVGLLILLFDVWGGFTSAVLVMFAMKCIDRSAYRCHLSCLFGQRPLPLVIGRSAGIIEHRFMWGIRRASSRCGPQTRLGWVGVPQY